MHVRRTVHVKVCPGEPTDGTGRICIHLFVQDPRGPVLEPHVLHAALDEAGRPVKGQVVAKPTRGKLACDGKRGVAPVKRGKVTEVTLRTDDYHAVTCPKCISSESYALMVAEEARILATYGRAQADLGGG